MSDYPYGKRKKARNRGSRFWVIPINVLGAFCLVLFIIGMFTGPVNMANASNFSICLRYMEFWASVPLEAAVLFVFLSLPFVYFVSIFKMRNTSEYNVHGKRNIFSFNAEKFHHYGIKGVVVGALLSLLLFALGCFAFLRILMPQIQDIPSAITHQPTALTAQVTDSHWVNSKYSTWTFKMKDQFFSTPFVTLKTDEYATIIYLQNSHFIIEYRHDKVE